MDQALRIEKIEKLMEDQKPQGIQNLYYNGEKKQIPVYRVPVSLLIFNQYNHRIASWIKTYSAEHDNLDVSTPEGEEIITSYLLNSDKKRNDKTKDDIKQKGQQQAGVITKDGIIADGNRRCLALKRIETEDNEPDQYFLAAILPDKFEDNRKEIMQLETSLQMGVDDKVDYDPIQKYLKVSDLLEEGYKTGQIANFMGEEEKKVKEYVSIHKLMNDYLEYIQAPGAYQVLVEKKLEGYFFNLAQHIKSYENNKNLHHTWREIRGIDLEDLKRIHFDYMRLEAIKSSGDEASDNSGKSGKYGSQELRPISNPSKNLGIFAKKDIWDKFSKAHDEVMDGIEEQSIDELKTEDKNLNLVEAIRKRDRLFTLKASPTLRKNFEIAKEDLENFRASDAPRSLLEAAMKKLIACQNADDEKLKGEEDIFSLAKQINQISYEIMKIAK